MFVVGILISSQMIQSVWRSVDSKPAANMVQREVEVPGQSLQSLSMLYTMEYHMSSSMYPEQCDELRL